MRTYEPKKFVTREECVKLTCDMCGIPSTIPESGAFDDGAMGQIIGGVFIQENVNGDINREGLDLCYSCSNWLMDGIKDGSIKRYKGSQII